jgi:hypothetical protein
MNRPRPFRPFRAAAASRPGATRRLRIVTFEDRCVPALFTVTDTGDNGGVNPAPFAGTGTLRQAIVDSDATPGTDTIDFALPDSLQSAGGWWTIQPAASLSTVADPVTIDGWSQAGAGPGLAPRVFIDGTNAVVQSGDGGLNLGSNSTVRGLAVGNFATAPRIELVGSQNTVVGSYLGLGPTGATAAPNLLGLFDHGSSNVVGGAGPGEGNVISGNFNTNLVSAGNGGTICGNFVGSDATGTGAIPTNSQGI